MNAGRLKKALVIMICVFSFFLIVAAGIYFYVRNKSGGGSDETSSEIGVLTEMEEAEDFYGWTIEGYVEYTEDASDLSLFGDMIGSVYKGKLTEDNRLYFWGDYGEGWLDISFSPDGVYEENGAVTLHSDESGTYLGLDNLYPYYAGTNDVSAFATDAYEDYWYAFNGRYLRVADGSTDILSDLETMVTESLTKEGAAYGDTDDGIPAATFTKVSCSSGTPFAGVLGKIAGNVAMTFDTDGEYGNRVAELNAETDDVTIRVQLIENPEYKTAHTLDESEIASESEIADWKSKY